MTQRNPKSSLKKLYLYLVVISGVILCVFTVITQLYVMRISERSAVNIQERQSVLSLSREIRNGLWASEGILTEHLLRPMDEAESLWRKHHEMVLAHLLELESTAWVLRNQHLPHIRKLHEDLRLYNEESLHLIRLRVNAEEQHPALYYARETMLPQHRVFVTSAALALEEIHEEGGGKRAAELTRQILNSRYLWTAMISSFRMYIINRLGSFDASSLKVQEQDIDTIYSQLEHQLRTLQAEDQTRPLGIQTEQSVELMYQALRTWGRDFNLIKTIHASPNWRTDVVILSDTIKPLDERILMNIQNLELLIETSAAEDVTNLVNMADKIVLALWLLLVLGLTVVAIGFAYLNRAILKPVATVTRALKAEALGKQAITLPEINTVETRDLVDAFAIMRKQVHSRQAALEHQAMHDSLTGLPNRNLLYDRLQQHIQVKHRENGSLALMLMDLDRFKEINDTLGHQVGDRILQQVGLRLSSVLRDTDTVARLGGDEFAIALEISDRNQIYGLAKKILESLETVFEVDGHHLYIGGSLGIALYPQHGDTVDTLIARADVAMYEAKRTNVGHMMYDPQHDQNSMGRLALANDLRSAIHNEELMIYYQPKVDLRTGSVMGVEALIRWEHPERGFIPADEIIYMAEHTGLIKPLTHWVLNEALKQCGHWKRNGLRLSMAINLSVQNLQDPQLVPTIEEALHNYKVPPELLVLEVTESAMMLDPAHATSLLSELDQMGVWISIDDYGTGFSSLAYLKQLPVDELKIDKSFVMNIHNNDNDAVIVRSTIDLARNLGLKAVAEGVENRDTWDLLLILGCDYAQGYYMSKPLPAHELETWLQHYSAA